MTTTGIDGLWCRVAAAAAADHLLPHAAFRVLCLLGKYADGVTHECYPSVTRLARLLSVSERQIQKHLRTIERLGYVSCHHRYSAFRGGNDTNLYVLRFPTIDRNRFYGPLMASDAGVNSSDTPERCSSPTIKRPVGEQSPTDPGVNIHDTPGVNSKGTTGVNIHDTQSSPFNLPTRNSTAAALPSESNSNRPKGKGSEPISTQHEEPSAVCRKKNSPADAYQAVADFVTDGKLRHLGPLLASGTHKPALDALCLQWLDGDKDTIQFAADIRDLWASAQGQMAHGG